MTEESFNLVSRLPCTAGELFDWHTRAGALERLTPPWEDVAVIEPARVADGECAVLEVSLGPLRSRWVARHEDVIEGRSFRDVQVAGPFAKWEHTHRFEPAAEGCTLADDVVFELPLGAAGRLLGRRWTLRKLERSFAWRHETTRRDVVRHAAYPGRRLRIAVSGAGGLIGRALCAFLRTGGHEVIELVRSRSADRPGQALWSVEHGVLEPERLEGIDALVHLAGAGIAEKRWTPARKELIRSSRVAGTHNLLRSLRDSAGLPECVATASAVGFYGDRGDEVLDESSRSGAGFLAEVCREWEQAAAGAVGDAARLVAMRFGVVTTPAGGALRRMLAPFRLGLGGPIGNGRQWMSWVSLDDAVHAVHHALTCDEVAGAVNVVAPAAVTNARWARALGHASRRPALLPMPGSAARALFGELASELLLGGQRVIPAALERSGFTFFDDDLRSCLHRLLGRETGALAPASSRLDEACVV